MVCKDWDKVHVIQITMGILQVCTAQYLTHLTYCGLKMPFGNIDLGQQWFR